MAEQNGRLKISPGVAWVIATSILAGGIAYGTLLHTVLRSSEDIREIKSLLKENYFTRGEISMIKQSIDADRADIHQRIRALELKKGKP